MSNGWRYALHTLAFGAAGPVLPFIVILLILPLALTSVSWSDMIGYPYMAEAVMTVYAYGGIPALVTGGVTAHAARRQAGWRLYGAAALAGFVFSAVWMACVLVATNRHTYVPPDFYLKSLNLLLFLGVCGALSALACTWLAQRLRPLPGTETVVTP